MGQKQLYHIALELVIEACANHQKSDVSLAALQEICTCLDSRFSVKDFSEELLGKTEFYNKNSGTDDESLFIREQHIPLLVRNGKLCTPADKFKAYIIIEGWASEYGLPDEQMCRKIGVSLGLGNKVVDIVRNLSQNTLRPELSDSYIHIVPVKSKKNEMLEGKWIEENQPDLPDDQATLVSDFIDKTVHAVYMADFNCFLIKCSTEICSVNETGSAVFAGKICIVQPGGNTIIGQSQLINFPDLKKLYIDKKFKNNFSLTALSAESNAGKKNGIRAFNFTGKPGEFIGIIGREGSGKTTMLEILSGIKLPDRGSVFVNAYDLGKNPYLLNGIVGYVPEADLLYHHLSVKDNLLFAARLYSGGRNTKNAGYLADNLLKELGLWEIRNEIVGKPREKVIQPGQRRLLNIALELIRDPQILIIDNAFSSLSMSDSSTVIETLFKYTFQGKLIITTITQTNQRAFNLFDKLFVTAPGGIPIYFGPRHQLLNHFLRYLPDGLKDKYNNKTGLAPEIIFDLIGTKWDFGSQNQGTQSGIDIEALYSECRGLNENSINECRKRKKLLGNLFHPPRLEKQFLVYSLRNLKVKFAQKKDIYFSLITLPLLAIIISAALRGKFINGYSFGQNPNIPAFFFISSIVMFFTGLLVAVKEIIGERHILSKEEHLNLSLFSYINSKFVYLLVLVAVQSLVYVFICNTVLQIFGLYFKHWLIYFSVALNGAITGLFLSSVHKKTESVLIGTVPLILLVLFIFGGGWIPLKQLSGTKGRYTPFVSDIVVSKLAYEALMVEQFYGNKWQKQFNQADNQVSRGSFNSYHLLPELVTYLDRAYELRESNCDSSSKLLDIIALRIEYYGFTEGLLPFEYPNRLNCTGLTGEVYAAAQDYLSYIDYYFYNMYNNGVTKKKSLLDSITLFYGPDKIVEMNNNYRNIYVEQKVRNTSARESFEVIGKHIVQHSDPIFQPPSSNFGRATLFSSQKRFNNQIVSTFLYNLSIMWLIDFIFYILLITGIAHLVVKHFWK